ncbi:MAG: hypothetical protein ACLUW6_08740 [Coriobacteriaceae bacterium]
MLWNSPHPAQSGAGGSGRGCEPARIAKTLSFAVGDRVALVVRGRCPHCEPEVQGPFGTKPRMLPAEEAEERVGHAVGGVCPSR